MGKRVLYTCDCCGSPIDLTKKVGILDYYGPRWTLNDHKYICGKCLEKMSLLLRK